MLATFNLQGYDPDINPEAYKGNKKESNERIFYFLASRRKMGMLLANQIPDLKFPSRWFKDDYEAARQDCYEKSCTNANGSIEPFLKAGTTDVTIGNRDGAGIVYEGSCANCAGGDRTCTTLRTTVNGAVVETPLNFTCELYKPWDNDINLAHQPPNLYLDKYTGVVQWETGISPIQEDDAVYMTDLVLDADPLNPTTSPGTVLFAKGTKPDPPKEPLKPGFYNVVFDVRSASHDPDCYNFDYNGPTVNPQNNLAYETPANGARYSQAQCEDISKENMIDIAYISAPIDFLLFLYQPAS
eukprot:880826-Pyramimonas_sp.AAC.1